MVDPGRLIFRPPGLRPLQLSLSHVSTGRKWGGFLCLRDQFVSNLCLEA